MSVWPSGNASHPGWIRGSGPYAARRPHPRTAPRSATPPGRVGHFGEGAVGGVAAEPIGASASRGTRRAACGPGKSQQTVDTFRSCPRTPPARRAQDPSCILLLGGEIADSRKLGRRIPGAQTRWLVAWWMLVVERAVVLDVHRAERVAPHAPVTTVDVRDEEPGDTGQGRAGRCRRRTRWPAAGFPRSAAALSRST